MYFDNIITINGHTEPTKRIIVDLEESNLAAVTNYLVTTYTFSFKEKVRYFFLIYVSDIVG